MLEDFWILTGGVTGDAKAAGACCRGSGVAGVFKASVVFFSGAEDSGVVGSGTTGAFFVSGIAEGLFTAFWNTLSGNEARFISPGSILERMKNANPATKNNREATNDPTPLLIPDLGFSFHKS